MLGARIFPALVFVVCVLVTAFAVSQMRATEADEAFSNFNQNTLHVARDAELRLASLAQLASAGASLLSAGESLGRQRWASYVSGLPTLGHGSGFQGLGTAFRVPVAGEKAFVAGVRKEVPGFRVWARPGTEPRPDAYYPVTQLVPVAAANDRLIGFDLGADPASVAAIELARDRGEPSFSALVKAGPEGDSTSHVMFLLAPFYRGGRPEGIQARREAFGGVVLIALRVERLLQPLMDQADARGIALRVIDLQQGSPIFDSRPGLDHARAKFANQQQMTLGGHGWRFEFAATPELAESGSRRSSLLLGLVGAFGTLALTGIVYLLATLRQHAEQRAREMTAELRASEAELLRHRDNLAELVAERTTDLLAAKNAAEQAYRIKSDFLANMSHELRTPLHGILSFARLGLERAGVQADEKTQRYLSRIVDAGERLLALVSDLLDLSKIEAGKMPIEPQASDLVALLREVAAEFEALAQERKLIWRLPPAEATAPAWVDPVRFAQVLRNVLSNAMKFSPDGAAIHVRVDAASLVLGRRAADRAAPVAAWRIAVIDEGVGIPEDELETVFDSFVQSSATRTGAGGTGLGLTICREIVAAHRGSIVARNRAEGGAEFEILVPSTVPGRAGDALQG